MTRMLMEGETKMKYTNCHHCDVPFQDRDYVAVSETERLFHYLIDSFDDDEPGGCIADAIEDAFQPDLVSFSPGVLFRGKVYDEADIRRLPNFSELSLELNPAGNGSRIRGDISGLLEMEPILDLRA